MMQICDFALCVIPVLVFIEAYRARAERCLAIMVYDSVSSACLVYAKASNCLLLLEGASSASIRVRFALP
jgi:hypothetical protein